MISLNQQYIIVEIIPTALSKDKGDLVQLSALKIDGICLLDRFDYRLSEEKIFIPEFIKLCSYDKENFTYLDSTEEILGQFKKWADNLPLIIIDNSYTRSFLEEFSNPIESISNYIKLDSGDDIIERMIAKYSLQPSNYIVDLIYEALIQESNN